MKHVKILLNSMQAPYAPCTLVLFLMSGFAKRSPHWPCAMHWSLGWSGHAAAKFGSHRICCKIFKQTHGNSPLLWRPLQNLQMVSLFKTSSSRCPPRRWSLSLLRSQDLVRRESELCCPKCTQWSPEAPCCRHRSWDPPRSEPSHPSARWLPANSCRLLKRGSTSRWPSWCSQISLTAGSPHLSHMNQDYPRPGILPKNCMLKTSRGFWSFLLSVFFSPPHLMAFPSCLMARNML